MYNRDGVLYYFGKQFSRNHINIFGCISDIAGVCEDYDFHCGAGFCVAFEAKCNGFQDCYNNRADELRCGK